MCTGNQRYAAAAGAAAVVAPWSQAELLRTWLEHSHVSAGARKHTRTLLSHATLPGDYSVHKSTHALIPISCLPRQRNIHRHTFIG